MVCECKPWLIVCLLGGLLGCSSGERSSVSEPAKVKVGLAGQGSDVVSAKAQGVALVASQAHMFELAPGQTHGAVYMVLSNSSDQTRQILDVSTPVAGTAMVHRTYYEDGMMRMRHVHHLSVGPKQSLAFQPNGYHIMLMDLDSVPSAGGTFVLTIALDQGQSLPVEVEVKSQH